MARHNKMAGAGAALLALVIALAVALTGTMVGLGSASASATAGVSSASTTSPTDDPTDDPTVSPTPTPTPTPVVPKACQEADKRQYYSTDGHSAVGRETGARVTKPVAGDGRIYVDARNTDAGVKVGVKKGTDQYYSASVLVTKDEGCHAITFSQGKWTLDLLGQAGGLDRYVIQISAGATPKLSFTVRHLRGQKYRLVWNTQHVTRLKAVLVRKNGHVIRTVLNTSKAKGSYVIRVAHPTRKRLRVVATGPGGRESRLVAFPRR